MMATLTAADLHERLSRAGHFCATGLWPTPETIVTVAMNLDPTHGPSSRRRYFACLSRSEEDPNPALRDEPAFALPVLFRELEPVPSEDPFLGGPFRWLLRRLIRFDRILLWPACRDQESSGGFTNPQPIDEVPELRRVLPADPAELAAIGAIVLDRDSPQACRILWQVANEVARSFYDFFVSDPNCNEVYRLHHHGKVVVSIPNEELRRELLDELTSWSSLIEDCSGYVSDWDDEE
jgi:hypothetical protein